MDNATKAKFLQATKVELMRDSWETFVDAPCDGPGRPRHLFPAACKKQFGTNTRYVEHFADNVMPTILLLRLPEISDANS
jgi:hypothetical protein